MKLGLLSDTHGYFDPRLDQVFAGVDHILHAGDIGSEILIAQLEALAPVTPVLGNTDYSPTYPLTQVVSLGGRKFLVQHIVSPRAPDAELEVRLARERPDFVIFGHSHKTCDETIRGVRFVNPGYAGRRRFHEPRSVALLDLDNERSTLRFVEL